MKSTIDHALYDPNQPLYQRLSAIQTQFDVTLGKIRALCSDSDIETLVNGDTTMYNRLANVELTATGLISDVSRVEAKYEAQSGQITTLQSDLSSFMQDESGFRQTVSRTYYTQENARTDKEALQSDISGISDDLEQNYSTTLQMQSAIEESARQIRLSVSETYATQTSLDQARNATIVSDQLHYLATSAGSGVTTETSGWTTSPQTVTETDKFLWTYHTYTYGDDHTSNTTPVITGTYGEKGLKGDKGDKGDTGEAAVTYEIRTSVDSIVRDKKGVASPRFVTFTLYKKTGAGSSTTNACYWKIEEYVSGAWTTIESGGAQTSSKTRYVSTNATSVRATAYADSSLSSSSIIDMQDVPIVSEGSDAYTVVLTNESHTFAGNETSALDNQTAECQIVAMKGSNRVAASIGTITGTPSGMTTSIRNNGSTSAKFTVSVTASMTTSNGVLTIPITVDGHVFEMTFTYSLALKGTEGTGILSATPIYYAGSSKPAAPTQSSQVSDSSIDGGLWTKAVPALTSTYQYLFTCDQIQYDDISVGANGFVWTEVVRDEAIRTISNRLQQAELNIEPDRIVASISNKATAKETLVEATAEAIRMHTGTISWEADNSSMTEEGILTCNGAIIEGNLKTTGTYTASRIGNDETISFGIVEGIGWESFEHFDFRYVPSNTKYVYTIGYIKGLSQQTAVCADQGNGFARVTALAPDLYASIEEMPATNRNRYFVTVRELFDISNGTPRFRMTSNVGSGVSGVSGNIGITLENGSITATPSRLYIGSSNIRLSSTTPDTLYFCNAKVQMQSTSAKRYKENIEDLHNADMLPRLLYKLKPKQFRYLDEAPVQYPDMRHQTIPGFIAEDVAEIYPSAAIRNEDGRVESWDERRIIPAMLALIQEQHERINALESKAN